MCGGRVADFASRQFFWLIVRSIGPDFRSANDRSLEPLTALSIACSVNQTIALSSARSCARPLDGPIDWSTAQSLNASINSPDASLDERSVDRTAAGSDATSITQSFGKSLLLKRSKDRPIARSIKRSVERSTAPSLDCSNDRLRSLLLPRFLTCAADRLPFDRLSDRSSIDRAITRSIDSRLFALH